MSYPSGLPTLYNRYDAYTINAWTTNISKVSDLSTYGNTLWYVFPPANMTADSTTLSGLSQGNGAYTASASSTWNTWNSVSFSPFYAFTKAVITGTYGPPTYNFSFWGSQTTSSYSYDATGTYYTTSLSQLSAATPKGEWLKIELPTSIVVKGYRLMGRSDTADVLAASSPKAFSLWASNDGTTWTKLDERTNITSWSVYIPNEFIITNTTSYTKYAVVITQITNTGIYAGSSGAVSIESFELLTDLVTYQPTYNIRALNNRPGMIYDSSGTKFMICNGPGTSVTAFTFAAVFSTKTLPVSGDSLLIVTSGSWVQGNISVAITSTTIGVNIGDNTGNSNSVTDTVEANSSYIIVFTFSSSSVKMRINGIASNTLSTVSSYLNVGSLSIGGYSGTTRTFCGRIGEILIYNSALSQADCEKVEGYLSKKWFPVNPLLTSHPYNSFKTAMIQTKFSDVQGMYGMPTPVRARNLMRGSGYIFNSNAPFLYDVFKFSKYKNITIADTETFTNGIVTTNLSSSDISGAYSVRRLNNSSNMPVIRVYRVSDGQYDNFFTDERQTYMKNSSNIELFAWLNSNNTNGRVSTWYDQSPSFNHATMATVANMPYITYNTTYKKYVLNFITSAPTYLTLTTGIKPKTLFCHFYNDNVADATLMGTDSAISMRLGYHMYGLPAGTSLNGDGNYNDWYKSCSGTKLAYANGIESTNVNIANWNVVSMSAQNPYFTYNGTNFSFFYIGRDNSVPTERSLNGYMSEIIFHSKEAIASDMVTYCNYHLFASTLPTVSTLYSLSNIVLAFDIANSNCYIKGNSILRDLSGLNNHFTFNTAAGRGVYYNSANNSLTLSNVYAIGPSNDKLNITNNFTIETYVKPSIITNTTFINFMGTQNEKLIGVNLPLSDNNIYFDARWTTLTGPRVNYTVTNPQALNHYIFRYQPSSLEIFENGVSKATLANPTASGTWGGMSTLFSYSNVTNPWYGDFYMMRIYNIALTDAQISQRYTAVTNQAVVVVTQTYYTVSSSTIYNPKIWLRIDELSSLSHGATLNTWSSVVNSITATSYTIGAGAKPVYYKNSELYPYVRMGTSAISLSDGNYLDCGAQTFNILTNGGFTVIAFIRYRIVSTTNWQFLFDFGSGENTGNIICGRFDINTYAMSYRTGSSPSDSQMGRCTIGSWQAVAFRFTSGEKAFFNPTKMTATNSTLENKSYSYTIIGKSWTSCPHLTADIREFLVYDKGLSDAEISNVFSYLNTKYADLNYSSPKIWFRIDELSSATDASSVTSWASAVNAITGTSYAVGGSANPKYIKTGDINPYVRFSGSSSTIGNYLDFGAQTFNMSTNAGITIIACFRFRTSPNTYERIFDIGNANNTDSILVAKLTTGTLAMSYRNGTTPTENNDIATVTLDNWQICAFRFITNEQAFFNLTTTTKRSNTTTLPDRSFINCYIGKSFYSSDPYANIDMREFLMYDKGLSDSEINTVLSYLNAKYSGIVTTNLVMWLDISNTNSYTSGSTTLKDISGTGNNFTLNTTTGLTYNTTSLNFNGSIYATGPTSDKFNITSDYTFEVVVKIAGANNTIFADFTGTLQERMLTTIIPWSDSNIYFDARSQSYSSYANNRVNYTTNNLTNLKHFIFRLSSGTMQIFENAVSKASRSSITLYGAWGGSTRLFWDVVSSSGWYWKGDFYLARLYNKALTNNEILQNFNSAMMKYNAHVTSGLTLYLDISNPASYVSGATTIYDLSPSQNNFTISHIANVTYNNTYITLTNNGTKYSVNGPTLDKFNITTEFTYETLVKTSIANTNVFMRFTDASGNVIISSHYVMADNNIYLDSRPAGQFGATNRITAGITNPTTTIYHIVFLFTSTTMSILVNNSQIGSTSYSSRGGSWTGGNSILFNQPGATNQYGGDWPWPGDFYYTRMYNRALNSTELTQNYNAAKVKYNF